MNGFKLKYYFEMYKDKVFRNSHVFRKEFIAKHGEFSQLSELVVMIYNYQAKKYGGRLSGGFLHDTREEVARKKINSKQRHRTRLGK
jgi:hypothetical protein